MRGGERRADPQGVTMSTRRTRVSVLSLLAVLCLAAASLAQTQTGDLAGVVRSDKGEPLPGVTVTITGVGGPKTVTSDADGDFRFPGLYPGTYALRAELAGFSPLEQKDVAVRLGGHVQVELTLASSLQETITVSAEQALVNPREQSQGPVLGSQELETIPTARDPWSLLRQAPGVVADRINVGGNESGQQSDFLAGGATSADNTFSVDGVVLTDMAAVGASATYFDFGAYEEVQLTTASTDVTVQTQGVTINQVTKRGTNEWKGDARYLSTEGSWQASPKEVDGNRIDSVEEWGANVGGPIVADHLWIWGSYGRNDIVNIAQGGQPDGTKLEDFNSKLNFQLGSNSGVFHYWTNDKIKNGRNAGPFFEPASTWDQTTPSDIWKLEDTQTFGSRFFASLLYSKDDGRFTLAPKGGLDADMYIDDDGVVHGSYFDFRQRGIITQYKGDASAFAETGSWHHEIKFGASWREQENDSISLLPRGRYVQSCVDWGCSEDLPADTELVVWTRHNVAVTSKYEAGWVQDTFGNDAWTFNAGVRYDKQTARNDAARDPGNAEVPDNLFPAIDFGGNDADNLDWSSIVPRVGATYSFGDRHQSLVRGTFSQYAAQLGQGLATRVGPFSPYSYVYYYFEDSNQDFVFDPTSEGGSLSYAYAYNVNLSDPASTSSSNRNDPDLKPYMTDEVSLSFEHGFDSGFAVSAILNYRNTGDLLEYRTLIFDENGNERVANRNDYTNLDADGNPLTETGVLPDGREVTVPVWDLKPGLSRTGGQYLTNGDREIDYWGLTLGFQKPMKDRWSLRGNVTYADSQIKVGDEFRFYDDPTNYIATGSPGTGSYGDDDDIFIQQSTYRAKRGIVLNNRWSFNVNGIYQVAPDRPWGFDLAASVTGREGYPSPPYRGSNSLQVQLTNDIDQFRNADIVTLDMRIQKEFKIRDLAMTASLDGFNLLNSQPVLQRDRKAPSDAADLPDSYPVVERLSPRVFRWGLTFHYR